MLIHNLNIVLALAACVHQVAFACSPCRRTGVYVDTIRTTSNVDLLAAEVSAYESNPYEPAVVWNATIHLSTGHVTAGWPDAEIHPLLSFWKREPVDLTDFSLGVDAEAGVATLTDAEANSVHTFDLPEREHASDDHTLLLWFVSPKFKLAYVLYNNLIARHGIVAIIPVMGREGVATYLYFPQYFEGWRPERGAARAYDDIQIATIPIPCCVCRSHDILFYNDTLVELRAGLADLGGGYAQFRGRGMAIVNAADIEKVVVYTVENKHLCRGEMGETFSFTKTQLASGEETDLPFIRDDVLALAPSECGKTSCPLSYPECGKGENPSCCVGRRTLKRGDTLRPGEFICSKDNLNAFGLRKKCDDTGGEIQLLRVVEESEQNTTTCKKIWSFPDDYGGLTSKFLRMEENGLLTLYKMQGEIEWSGGCGEPGSRLKVLDAGPKSKAVVKVYKKRSQAKSKWFITNKGREEETCVFNNCDGTSCWVQLGSSIEGPQMGDKFGAFVSLSADGSRLAISAPKSNAALFRGGLIQVYDINESGAFAQVGQDIVGDGIADEIRAILSKDGRRLAVGAPYNGITGTQDEIGQVRILELQSDAWSPLGDTIYGTAAKDESGLSFAMSFDGSIVATGPYFDDGARGHVRVRTYTGGEWVQLGASIEGGTADNRFGWQVALSDDGSVLVVGSPGQVRAFRFESASWVQMGNIVDSKDEYANFSEIMAVSSDGKTFAATAAGRDHFDAVRVYSYADDGSKWQQIGEDIQIPETLRGLSLSSDGKRLAAIFEMDYDLEEAVAHANVFAHYGGSWRWVGGRVTVPSADENLFYGISISADATRLAVGSSKTDPCSLGVVQVHDLRQGYNPSSPSLVPPVTPCPFSSPSRSCNDSYCWALLGSRIEGPEKRDRFGAFVSLSADGSRLAISAPGGRKQERIGVVRVYDIGKSGSFNQVGQDIAGDGLGDEVQGMLSKDGRRVAVSAPFNDGSAETKKNNIGQVRIFELQSDAWLQLGDAIYGTSAKDELGRSFAISYNGSIVATGAWRFGDDERGQVRIFSYTGSAWVQLGASIEGEAASDRFGLQVAMSDDGSVLLVGSYFVGMLPAVGQVRAFRFESGGWAQMGNAIDGKGTFDYFGEIVTVSSDGKTLAASAVGTHTFDVIRIYAYADDTSEWQQAGDIQIPETLRGLTLSSTGTRLAAIFTVEDIAYINVYDYGDGLLQQVGGRIAASDHSLASGISISSTGTRLAVGSGEDDPFHGGMVQVFDLQQL